MAGRNEKIQELRAQAKKLAEEAVKLEKKTREENMLKIGKLVLDKYVKNKFNDFIISEFQTEVQAIINE